MKQGGVLNLLSFLSGSKDYPKSILIDRDSNQNADILIFAAPVTFQVFTINAGIGIKRE